MFSERHILIILSLFALGLSACSRPQSEVAKISISLPSSMNSGQGLTTADKLGHVIINVTGVGIAEPILFVWDKCHNCQQGFEPPPPTSFDLEIPMGPGRLIQVLAVYQNSTTGTMVFYYGDSPNVILNTTLASVTIPLAFLTANDNQPSIGGNIAGRYLYADGTGPTGEVFIKFNPGAGRQKLIIEKSKIVAGWFQFFGLDNVNFEYQLASTGEYLFGNAVSPGVNLNSAVFSPTATILKAGIPKHYRYDTQSSTNSSEDAQIFAWGWFGDAAAISSNQVCYSGISGNYAYLKKGSDSTVPLAAQTGTITKASLLDPAFGYVNYQGGTSSCAGSTVNVNYLAVTKALIDGEGNDKAAGFRVPFDNVIGNQIFSISSDTSGHKVIAGKVLPGIQNPSIIHNFNAYKKSGAGFSYNMDQVSCSAVRAGLDGWVLAGSGSPNGDVQVDRTFIINTNVTAAEASLGVVMALCASSASGGHYEEGAFLSSNYFGSSNLGGIADHGVLSFKAGYESIIPIDRCVQAQIDLRTSNDQWATASSAITVHIESSSDDGATWSGAVPLWPTSNCSPSAIPGGLVTFNSGDSQRYFYVLNVTGTTLKFRVVKDSGILPGSWMSEVIHPLASSNLVLKLALPERIYQGQCYPVELANRSLGSNSISWTGTTSVTISSTVGGTAALYSSSSCIPSTVFTSSAGTTPVVAYFKVTGYSAPTSKITVNLSASGYANIDTTTVYLDYGLATPTQIQINSQDGMSAGQCYLVQVSALGVYQTQTPVPAAQGITLSTTAGFNGRFYTDSNCTAGEVSTAFTAIPVGDYRTPALWFKPISVPVAGPGINAASANLGAAARVITNYQGITTFTAAPGAGSVCKPINFTLTDPNSVSVVVTPSMGWMLSLNPVAVTCTGLSVFGGFYADSTSCIAGTAPITNAYSASTTLPVYMKNSGSTGSCSFTFTSLGSGFTGLNATGTVPF